MELPRVIDVPLSNDWIDQKLAANLDKEGLLRLRAVEKTVELFSNKGLIAPDDLSNVYETIYKFLKDGINQQTGTTR